MNSVAVLGIECFLFGNEYLIAYMHESSEIHNEKEAKNKGKYSPFEVIRNIVKILILLLLIGWMLYELKVFK